MKEIRIFGYVFLFSILVSVLILFIVFTVQGTTINISPNLSPAQSTDRSDGGIATWYNEFGHDVATSVSQTYSSEGGKVTFSTPNVSNWLNGNYLILVHSTETPTEGSVLGASGIWVHGNENPEPPPQPNPCLQPIPQCSY